VADAEPPGGGRLGQPPGRQTGAVVPDRDRDLARLVFDEHPGAGLVAAMPPHVVERRPHRRRQLVCFGPVERHRLGGNRHRHPIGLGGQQQRAQVQRPRPARHPAVGRPGRDAAASARHSGSELSRWPAITVRPDCPALAGPMVRNLSRDRPSPRP
jgi:hypothetical protein